jgi:hypothetical protein
MEVKMKNLTETNKGKLPARLMKRVDSCAHIFIADKPEKISQIMADKGVDELEAGRIYTIGALKAAKRRGTAKNYIEAVSRLEMEQVGDRGCPLTRTVNADKAAMTVAKYKRMTGGGYLQASMVDAVRTAWARMDNQPVTAYVQPVARTVPKNVKQAAKLRCPPCVGKALGQLYTEWEERTIKSGPEYVYTNMAIVENLKRFFNEYLARQSKTVNKRLSELKEFVRSKNNKQGVDVIVKSLLSNAGKESADTARLANFAVNLWRQFEHKDSLSVTEFTELLYRYGLDR